jgi:glutamate-5-semialdehyde dehydrogenase
MDMTQFSAQDIARAAKQAFEQSQLVPSSERIAGLHEIRKELAASKDQILAANKDDLDVSPHPPAPTL